MLYHKVLPILDIHYWKVIVFHMYDPSHTDPYGYSVACDCTAEAGYVGSFQSPLHEAQQVLQS